MPNRAELRQWLKLLLPPFVGRVFAWFNGLRLNGWKREWVCLGEQWPETAGSSAGWNEESIARVEEKRMRDFAAVLKGRGPMSADLAFHNTYMVFGTALGRVAQGKAGLAFLDYGGGAGRYYMIAQALQPDLAIAYTCKEMPVLCAVGQRLLPEARFVSDDAQCFDRRYDFVMASTSLHYAREWKELVRQLVDATAGHLLITRLPVVVRAKSFVVLQRPLRHGYDSEYACWFLNRREFLDYVATLGLELEREYLLQERPRVAGAPEQCEYASFLFVRSSRGT